MLSAIIEIPNEEGLDKIFEEQSSSFKHARATYQLKKENKKLIFHIQAKDSGAMRATTNSILVTLNIYEKAKKV